MSAGGDRLELGPEAGRGSATTPGDVRGRLRASITRGLEVREAAESATAGPGLYVAGERVDRDEAIDLVREVGLWLDEVRPGWRRL